MKKLVWVFLLVFVAVQYSQSGSKATSPVFDLTQPGGSSAMPLPNTPVDLALTEDALEVPPEFLPPVEPMRQNLGGNLLVAHIAVEADYEFYQLFGDLTAANNYVSQLIGAVSDIYERDIQVQLVPSFVRIATTANDPWTAVTSSAALQEVGNYWNTYEAGRQRATVLFLSGKNLGGGVAWLGTVCNNSYSPGSSYDYAIAGSLDGSFSTTPGSNTWDLVVVAHELGHNFNSKHSHCYTRSNDQPYDRCYASENGCYAGNVVATTGTIMSYCHINAGGMSNINPLSFTDGDPVMVNVMRSFAESKAVTQAYGCLDVVGAPATYWAYLPIGRRQGSVASSGASGRVTEAGAPVAGTAVYLDHYTNGAWVRYDTATTDSNGNYTFAQLPTLASGEVLSVWWANTTNNSNRLWNWFCDDIYPGDKGPFTCNFDLQNIVLSSPTSGSSVALPTTFSWVPRATTSDSYVFVVADVNDYDPAATSAYLGYVDSFTVTGLPSGFVAGVSYGWWVRAYGPNGYGSSYYYRPVTFTNVGLLTGETSLQGLRMANAGRNKAHGVIERP